MNMDNPYNKRELDAKFSHIHEDISSLKESISKGFEGVHFRQDIANGKVNKVVIALVFAFGLIVGLGFVDFGSALPLLF